MLIMLATISKGARLTVTVANGNKVVCHDVVRASPASKPCTTWLHCTGPYAVVRYTYT